MAASTRPEPPPIPDSWDPAKVPTANPDGKDLVIVADTRDHPLRVGDDIVPGPYRSMGPRGPGPCSWSVNGPEDMSEGRGGSDGPLRPTITSGVSTTRDAPLRVMLEPGDSFDTGGCQPWVYYGP